MRDFNLNDPFLFGEWFGISWFHNCYTEGIIKMIPERIGYGLSQVVDEGEGDVKRVYFSRAEWTAIGERYLSEVVADPAKLKTVLGDIRSVADKLIIFSRDLARRAEDNFSREEQIAYLDEFHRYHHALWSLGQIPNVLELENSFLTDYLKDWLRGQGSAEEEMLAVFQTLVTPHELSMAQHEERDMLRLAAEPYSETKLWEHWQTYRWIHFGWVGPGLTPDYFVEVYRGLQVEGNSSQKLSVLLEKDRRLIADKARLLEELKLPKKIQVLFRLLEDLLFVKTHRMDALFMSYDATQPILKQIAREHFLSLQQVYAIYSGDLVDMLRSDEFDVHQINETLHHSAWYYDGDEVYRLKGDAAENLLAKVKKKLPPPKLVSELKGECAYPGVVQGRVSIINRAEEMVKFADGDVLVSNITDPSLLPIMKRAVAFVTNAGGLTCHAAIVARELGKPCVVGTKSATHVLKDGDLVEVNATRGIVTRLHEAKPNVLNGKPAEN